MYLEYQEVVKLAAEKIKQPLRFIFNESLNQFVVPKQLKVAVIHPLHKEELLMQVSKCMTNIHSSNNKENL